MSHASILSPVNLPLPSARPVPRPSRSDSWNVLADIEVFIFAVEAELEAMDRERVGVHRRGCKPDLSLRRRVIGLIWMLTFGGMQWRIAGLLSGIPFTTLHTSFARWSRRGLWRRLGQRLALDWRLACGDEVLPSAVVADSRSLRSAPTARARGIDGGKLVKGIKLCVVCDKHGSLLDLELHPANSDDRAGILPALPRLAALGFQGDLLGDSGYKGAPFAEAALEHDIHVVVSPGGTRDGRFLPRGIRWVVAACTILPGRTSSGPKRSGVASCATCGLPAARLGCICLGCQREAALPMEEQMVRCRDRPRLVVRE